MIFFTTSNGDDLFTFMAAPEMRPRNILQIQTETLPINQVLAPHAAMQDTGYGKNRGRKD